MLTRWWKKEPSRLRMHRCLRLWKRLKRHGGNSPNSKDFPSNGTSHLLAQSRNPWVRICARNGFSRFVRTARYSQLYPNVSRYLSSTLFTPGAGALSQSQWYCMVVLRPFPRGIRNPVLVRMTISSVSSRLTIPS